jgi:hypothetical protein
MYIITITECFGERRVFTSRHRVIDEIDGELRAIDRAVAKHYGRKKYFVIDRGLSAGGTRKYGVIGHSYGGSTSVDTGRVAIDVDEA